jgi:hypothetical protein
MLKVGTVGISPVVAGIEEAIQPLLQVLIQFLPPK